MKGVDRKICPYTVHSALFYSACNVSRLLHQTKMFIHVKLFYQVWNIQQQQFILLITWNQPYCDSIKEK